MSGPSVLTLTASANNNIGGPITVSGGTLQGTAASMATPIVLANNANVTYIQNTDGTLSTPVRGNGSVIKTGAGVLTLGAPSFYQGATTISAGTLRLPASAANAGLVVRYSMDGPLGAVADGTTIVDLGFSPNGNNGTMVGAGANRVAGQFGQGIQFNGFQYIKTPYSSSIDLHAWTTSLWINVDTSVGNDRESSTDAKQHHQRWLWLRRVLQPRQRPVLQRDHRCSRRLARPAHQHPLGAAWQRLAHDHHDGDDRQRANLRGRRAAVHQRV